MSDIENLLQSYRSLLGGNGSTSKTFVKQEKNIKNLPLGYLDQNVEKRSPEYRGPGRY